MLLSIIKETLRKSKVDYGTEEKFNDICLSLENNISDKIMNSFQEFYLEQVNKQNK